MDREQKNQQVEFIKEKFENAKSIIFADYRGLNVAEITELRSKLGQAESNMKVVKNRLAKRALSTLSIEGLDEYLTGPTAMAYSDVDPVNPAKILVDFAKDHKVLDIKAGYMDGSAMDLDTIKHLAALPTKDVLLGKMLGSISAPATNLTMVLAALPRQLVTVIDKIKDSKQA